MKPLSYRFVNGKPVPYEFVYNPEQPNLSDLDKHATFVKELSAVLARQGFENIFGIRDLDFRDDGLALEITMGRMNAMACVDDVPAGELATALWIFDKALPVAGDDGSGEPNCLHQWCYRQYCNDKAHGHRTYYP